MILASTATGDIIPDATVTVRNPGTTTNISETIFANDDPDTTQLTNGVFKTDARGLAIFYLTNQKRVDVLFTKTGYTSVTIPVDVQKSALVSGESVATSTIWDAKGDLAAGTGADAASRLAVGANDTALTADSAQATGLKWVAYQALSDVKAVRKAADESVTSSTALQDDDALLFAVGASQTWVFEFFVYASGPTAGDINITLTAPAGAAGGFHRTGPDPAITSASGSTQHKGVSVFGDASARSYGVHTGEAVLIHFSGSIVNGATAGNVVLRWAQATSDATATTVWAHSFLTARRIP